MGDFNGKVGCGRWSKSIGSFGRSNGNEIGNKLSDFCDQNN